MWKFVIDRLKEPSTYAGVAVLLGFAGVKLSPEAYGAGIELLSAGAAFLSLILPERLGSLVKS